MTARKKPRYQRHLFLCTVCGCLDDQRYDTTTRWSGGRDKAQCTLCHTGEWHHIFPRKTPEEWGFLPDKNGAYGPRMPTNNPGRTRLNPAD